MDPLPQKKQKILRKEQEIQLYVVTPRKNLLQFLKREVYKKLA
jgi:hypothetical protein